MHAFSMVSTSKGILVLGGNSQGVRRHSEILQLDCQDAKIENCEWKPIVQKMEVVNFAILTKARPLCLIQRMSIHFTLFHRSFAQILC